MRAWPDGAREWQDQLLKAWPDAVMAKTTGAANQAVRRAKVVADAVAANGDHFLSDAVSAVLRAQTDPVAVERFAAAHAAFRDAMRAYNEDRIRESMPVFEAALVPLERREISLRRVDAFSLAIGRYYVPDLAGALAAVDPVIQHAQAHGYARLSGLAHRLKGLIAVVRGDYANGLEGYRTALAFFEQARDQQNQASMHALLAEAFDFVGEPSLVWNELVKGLGQLDAVTDRRHRHTVFQDSALAALRQGLPETAAFFQQATLDNAERWGRPLAVVNAHLYRGEISRQLGDVRGRCRGLPRRDRRSSAWAIRS